MVDATISLEALKEVPALPRNSHIYLLQKCCVCFDNRGFGNEFFLLVECKGIPPGAPQSNSIFKIKYAENVDDILRGAHADLSESVEDSAKAIGMLLIKTLTPYKTCRQAPRGTHIDYYMVDKNAELPFQIDSTAGVEFTGILRGVDKIEARIEEKIKRLHKIRDFPIYIVCVEHNFPLAKIERIEP